MQVLATLPASDIDRARKWYSEKLGLEPVDTSEDGSLYYEIDGSRFLVYPSQFAGTNQATAAGLVVDNFDSAKDDLSAKGVVFEDYDLGEDFRTENGVITNPDGSRAAWFKDSEGNILAVTEDLER